MTRTSVLFAAACFGCAALLACSSSVVTTGQAEPKFLDEFGESNADFECTGSNPYFSLEVGYVLEFEGVEDRRVHHLTITVLDETEMVGSVKTRVIEERETVSGELEEVSRNYFAISKRTNSVYYFGEEVDMYKLGEVTSHEGSWRADKDGNRYGLFMPGNPAVGMRFFQEVAPNVAMDRAEIVGMDAKLTTPAGTYDHLLKWEETSLLEPGVKEYKFFAKGIGLVRDSELSLVKYGKAPKK